jgi:putative ABC transport system permease protein
VRLTLLLLSVAASAALLLGIVGVYSVVSYAAAGRLREFGVRLALGATPRGVASIVLHDGAIVGVVGVAGGLAVAFAGTRFLESLLFEVSATSGQEFGAAVLLIAFVTLVATFIPARRASRTDPAVVLRGE